LELDWKSLEEDCGEMVWIAKLGVFGLAGYARSLRGEEITKIELGGVRKHFADGGTSSTPHVMFTLVGRFKGYQGKHHHLMLTAAVTGSGLEVRTRTEHLLLVKEKRGAISGFMFARRDGSKAGSSDFEMDIADRLVWFQINYPAVIPKAVFIYAAIIIVIVIVIVIAIVLFSYCRHHSLCPSVRILLTCVFLIYLFIYIIITNPQHMVD
jgi:hypothetical protein